MPRPKAASVATTSSAPTNCCNRAKEGSSESKPKIITGPIPILLAQLIERLSDGQQPHWRGLVQAGGSDQTLRDGPSST